jgi:hypothetical protein
MNAPNANWINHDSARQRSMDRAQRAYDAQMPPEDHNCEEDGHDWRRLPGEAKDGTRFTKCRKCGLTEESQ